MTEDPHSNENSQQTLNTSIEFEGRGLHEGQPAIVRILPAEADTGFVFVRVDLDESPEIPASVENVAPGDRRTLLRRNEAEVHTCEHLLAGLYGSGVDNARIEIEGPEAPALDGSAGPYAEAAVKAGLVAQEAQRRVFVPRAPIVVHQASSSITLTPNENSEFVVEYLLDYGNEEIPFQHTGFRWTPDRFVAELAPARTFCLKSEAEALQKAGFGKGADTTNTLVVDGDSVVENTLRFNDEFARHKALDAIGDIALSGCRVLGDLTCVRSGHDLNQQMAKAIRDGFARQQKAAGGSLPGAMNHAEILDAAPHRYPFLMIDRVIESQDDGRLIIGYKNVSFNEPFFQGHFPEKPVMPGVLQIEAMAQLAGITLCKRYPDTIGLLTGIEKAKFRREVLPGDQLMMEAEIIRDRRGVIVSECKAMVDGELASSATIRFMLLPKDKVS